MKSVRTPLVGDHGANHGIVTREQLDAALVRRKTLSHLRLGDALVQEKLITAGERDAALAMQAGDRRKLLGEILIENGVVTREEVRHVLAEQLGVPSVNLARFQYDPEAVKAVSAELARKYMVMPLYRTDSRIAVGIENPLSWEALQELELFTGLKVDPAMATHEDLLAAIAQFYIGVAVGEQSAQIVVAPGVESRALEPANEEVVTADDTLVRLANKMFRDAFDQGTFNIHIESMPGDKPSRVRFRVDGILAP
jgi:hypothetical protein